MTNKEIYKALCEQEELPLFMQYWWLEGVSAGHEWDVVLVTEEAPAEASETGVEAMPRVLAAMPYECTKHLWARFIDQPVLCPYGGIWFAKEVLGDSAKIGTLCEAIDAQVRALKVVSYNQHYLPDNPASRSLELLGYTFVNRRTYVLDDVQDLNKVLDGFSRNKRKKLEKNAALYRVEDVDAETFYTFHHQTSQQKKQRLPYSRETLLVMTEKALERKQARLVGVRNADGQLLAAAVLVWDKQYCYQLLNSFDHDYPDCGARELLTLEAIKQTRQLGLKLDFTYHRDYLKHYGAKRSTYYSIHKGKAFFVTLQRFLNWRNRG